MAYKVANLDTFITEHRAMQAGFEDAGGDKFQVGLVLIQSTGLMHASFIAHGETGYPYLEGLLRARNGKYLNNRAVWNYDRGSKFSFQFRNAQGDL
jgi:hypothetical protein